MAIGPRVCITPLASVGDKIVDGKRSGFLAVGWNLLSSANSPAIVSRMSMVDGLVETAGAGVSSMMLVGSVRCRGAWSPS